MKPNPIDVLNGVKKIIFEVLVPELQTPQARGQALYTALLLDHLAARWEIEYPLLVEEHNELRALAQLAAQASPLDAGLQQRCAAAVLATVLPAEPTGPRLLSDGIEELRKLASALATQPNLPAAVRDTLHAYLRNQHARDQRIVAVGELAW